MKNQLLAIWIVISRKSFQNLKIPETYFTILCACQGNIHLTCSYCSTIQKSSVLLWKDLALKSNYFYSHLGLLTLQLHFKALVQLPYQTLFIGWIIPSDLI